jgi:PmbA protein
MSEKITPTQLLEGLATQVDEAELFELRSYELPINFRAGELESIRSVETAGRALRVIHDGRLGFSTTTDLADASTIVHNARASAQFGDKVSFEFPSPQTPSAVQCFDPQVDQLDEKQLVELGKESAERLRAFNPELQVEVALEKRIEEVRLLNTNGLEREDRRTSLELSVEVTQTREDDILILWRSASSRQRRDIDGQAMAEEIIERLRWSENTAVVESKPMPVVFYLDAVPTLLLPLMVGLNGRNVFLNTSPLGKRLDQTVFDSRLTLVDNGCLDFGARSAPFDDEGIPTASKTLIEEGRLCQFLYDLRTAAQSGTQPTGNGFKSGLFGGGFRQQPSVAPSNWVLSPGDQGLEQLLQGLEEALLVEGVIGLGQGNIIAGEFSNNVGVGFLVRRGEIVGRVKNTMIAGNVYELLKDNVLALSDRPEWVFGILNTPAIAIDAVSVASKS